MVCTNPGLTGGGFAQCGKGKRNSLFYMAAVARGKSIYSDPRGSVRACPPDKPSVTQRGPPVRRRVLA